MEKKKREARKDKLIMLKNTTDIVGLWTTGIGLTFLFGGLIFSVAGQNGAEIANLANTGAQAMLIGGGLSGIAAASYVASSAAGKKLKEIREEENREKYDEPELTVGDSEKAF